MLECLMAVKSVELLVQEKEDLKDLMLECLMALGSAVLLVQKTEDSKDW